MPVKPLTPARQGISDVPHIPGQPPQPVPMPLNVVDEFEGIEARPLQLPNFCDLVPTNSSIVIRWVNRVAGNPSGQRYHQMVAVGFVPAEIGDAKMPNGSPIPEHLLQDGRIINGDVVLMKIDRRAYLGGIKYNNERAIKAATVHAAQKRETARVADETKAPPDILNKLQVFAPSQQDAELLTGAALDKK